jgi:hypothetical protein
MIEDYELETLREIEKAGSRLNWLSNSHICDLYREWSSITANAGWLAPTPCGISSFVEWATTAPCDVPTDADTPKSCDPGYYIAKWGFDYQIMRIRRHLNGLVKHNYGWETEKKWLSRTPAKIERPTLWDRISNIF